LALKEIYDETKDNDQGALADYIPELAKANPKTFAVSICTVGGQRFSIGESKKRFCIQSTSKPFGYCFAEEVHGPLKVHNHVGKENSGEEFNAVRFDKKGRPHNPLNNAGAIMINSLILPEKAMADRYNYIEEKYKALTGGTIPSFDNKVYQSEKRTADKNFALGYLMKNNGIFPEGTDLHETEDLYFQHCSLQLNSNALAVAAGTLANAGQCPLTEERVFKPSTVKIVYPSWMPVACMILWRMDL